MLLKPNTRTQDNFVWLQGADRQPGEAADGCVGERAAGVARAVAARRASRSQARRHPAHPTRQVRAGAVRRKPLIGQLHFRFLVWPHTLLRNVFVFYSGVYVVPEPQKRHHKAQSASAEAGRRHDTVHKEVV